MATGNNEKTTHFGYEDVAWGDKQSRVRDVFDSVAGDYDRMNDFMSLGMHRAWKNAFVAQLDPRAGEHVLDMAGGTGDITFKIKKKCPLTEVTVCDINQEMLEVGKARQLDKGVSVDAWVHGNAESLEQFDAMSFNAYTIAFGIRNVTDIPAALREAYRVLKFGGRFMCLEFSQVRLPIFKEIYDTYSFKVIPAIGDKVAKDREAYQYLVESIRKFPSREEFADMIKAAGFDKVDYRIMSGGAVAIHSGWKI